LEHFFDFVRRVALFEHILLVLQRGLVVVVTEQRVAGLDIVNGLHFWLLACAANLRTPGTRFWVARQCRASRIAYRKERRNSFAQPCAVGGRRKAGQANLNV